MGETRYGTFKRARLQRVNTDFQSVYDCLALLVASRLEGIDGVRALLEAGADVNARDTQERTPLMGASSKNDVRVVKFLIQSGAHVNVRNKDGRTALMIASEQEEIDVLSQAGDTSRVGS